MEEYIAFDWHKRYTWVEHEEVKTGKLRRYRLEHAPGAINQALSGCAPGTAVAPEATANWYWIVDEIEPAGLRPRLVHPRKAKLMMGQINKTDQLDAHGLNTLQRNRTLPTVWIPPGPLRELRELTRPRVVLVAQRTRWKNRLTATLAKYGLPASEYSDPYGQSARAELASHLERLPEQTRWAAGQMLAQLDALSEQIQQFEPRLKELVEVPSEMQRLMSLPGVGVILAATMALEIGEIGRFASAEPVMRERPRAYTRATIGCATDARDRM
jgi:transposase